MKVKHTVSAAILTTVCGIMNMASLCGRSTCFIMNRSCVNFVGKGQTIMDVPNGAYSSK